MQHGADDDIIGESFFPIPPGGLFDGSPAGSLTVRHHRPMYDDEIPDDSRNPERLAAMNEQLDQSFSKVVDQHLAALTPRERAVLEKRFATRDMGPSLAVLGTSPEDVFSLAKTRARRLERAAHARLRQLDARPPEPE